MATLRVSESFGVHFSAKEKWLADKSKDLYD